MKKRLLLLIFLIVPLVLAQDIYNTNSLEINLEINSELNIIRESSSSTISKLTANLSLFPKDNFQQEVLSLTTDPISYITDNYVSYVWSSPTNNQLYFRLSSKVKTYNKQIQIKEKIKFPINIKDELKIYTKPSETIDSDNPTIFALANYLAEGEDDLYKVVFNLGKWVKNNIEYDLSTLTADVTQKSSWVLETRQGVCDELTNLFIALNRALGIPSKFVSGISYTNSDLFEERWGPHGWAEVYFPDYGWIPYDVTYGEFGHIDPSHIKLKEALDADEASTKYQWFGRNINIETNPLNFNIEVTDYGKKISPRISLEVESDKSQISFGSYNMVEAKIKNLEDYYIAEELYLSKPKEVQIIDEERKQILLKPNEEKTVFWTIKVNNNLKQNYIYTFPLLVTSTQNISFETSFSSTKDGYTYTLEEIGAIRDIKEVKDEKILSEDVNLRCIAEKLELYEYEQTNINCDIKNTGTTLLDNIDICLQDDCQNLNLGIGEEKQLQFIFIPNKIGEQELLLEAKNQETLYSKFIELNVLDIPSIEIKNLKYPKTVSFNDNYQLSFIIDKASASNPSNIEIEIDQQGFKKTWTINELPNDKEIVVDLKGKDLSIGVNSIKILLTYYDSNNKQYTTSDEAIITLKNVNVIERLQIFLTDIAKFFGRLFT